MVQNGDEDLEEPAVSNALAMHPGYEFTTETNGHLLATGDKINSISAQNHQQGLAMHPGYEFTTETNGHLLATGDKINCINAQNHEQGLAMHPGYEFTTETNGHLLATRDKINSINAQNHEQGLAMHPGYEFTTETNGHLLATRDKINSINAQNHEQGVLWTRAYLPPAKSAPFKHVVQWRPFFVGTNAVRGIRIVAPVNVRGTTSTKGASAIASCSVVKILKTLRH
ncbi:uncharacterized protein LOC142575557 isoform X6 [Dermacentor variabilis]|uniref:uncharacterized protein LOC142575557 isoform X6 n=2 Tax=Dermacentor variabilis TaxID=34621 RepID=UPI003F5BDB52